MQPLEQEKHREDMLWLKDALGLSMSDLAIALNVSCAELYHWLDKMCPLRPKQSEASRLRYWVEQNISEPNRKRLKHIWHHQIDSNITLLTLLHKGSCGESLGKIKVNEQISRLLRD